MNGDSKTTAASGSLLLVPNTLDLGAEEVAITDVLADGVLQRAAALRHWVVEDARSARAFLKRVGARHTLVAPLQALDITELPRPRKGSGLAIATEEWQRLLQPARAGHDIGLLSEAGLPAVADPGAELVCAAHAGGITVEALPGPSSLLLALSASGLNGQSFAFVGYLPQDPDGRRQRLMELESASARGSQTQLFIETPYRNAALWSACTESLRDSTRLAIGCGISLPGGWTRSLTISAWKAQAPNFPDRWPAVFALLAESMPAAPFRRLDRR